MVIFSYPGSVLAIVVWAMLSGITNADAQIDCGQVGRSSYRQTARVGSTVSTDPIVIDYAVFFTPAARTTQGGTDAMIARIEAAFREANELFTLSGTNVSHRVVATRELPLDNSSMNLPDLNSELAMGFDFFQVLDSVKADTALIIVDFQVPGGFANIPGSPGQAGRGATINLGLPNLSGLVLAHEIGHTLGLGHDYADLGSSTFVSPTYNYGNHFIGTSTGTCYRTIMSALTTCRVPGFAGVPTVNCKRFSSPSLLFDGAPTGDVDVADAVRMIGEFGPFLANARGEVVAPVPSPNPSETPAGDELTLRLKLKNRRVTAGGKCVSGDGRALIGDIIDIYRVNPRTQNSIRLKSATCGSKGTYRVQLSRRGRYMAVNNRTGTGSAIAEI